MAEIKEITPKEREEFCIDFYQKNECFKLFIDRFAHNEHISVEETLKRSNAYETGIYYLMCDKDKAKNTIEETMNVGCSGGNVDWSEINCHEDE